MDDEMKETVMNQKIDLQETEIAGLSCKIALPPGYDASDQSYPVIYINGDIPLQEVIAETVRAGACRDFIMTAVIPGNWNDDFTPWGAPAIRKGEAPPKGQADQYIARLTEHIKPFMDSMMVSPNRNIQHCWVIPLGVWRHCTRFIRQNCLAEPDVCPARSGMTVSVNIWNSGGLRRKV